MKLVYLISTADRFRLKAKPILSISYFMALIIIVSACEPELSQSDLNAGARLGAAPTQYSRMVITNHGFSQKADSPFLPVTVYTRGLGHKFSLANLTKGWAFGTSQEIVLDYTPSCQCYTYYGDPVTYVDLNDLLESDDIKFTNSGNPNLITYQANRTYAGVLINGYKNGAGKPQFYQSILDKDGIARLGSAVLDVSFETGHGRIPGYSLDGPIHSIYIDIQRYNGQALRANYALPVLYSDCGFSSSPILVDKGRYTMAMLQTLGVGNDQLSSLRIPAGYQVIVYDQNNFGGASKSFKGPLEINCLKDQGFNDITSSIVINKL